MKNAARKFGSGSGRRQSQQEALPAVAAAAAACCRCQCVFLFGLLALIVIPTVAWGGIYNPCEADEGPSLPEWESRGTLGFKSTFLRYRSLGPGGVQFDNPTRRRYQFVEKLGTASLSRLSLLEKLALSEYLIRRGDNEGAKQVLKGLMTSAEKSPVNFLFYCNMAAACQQLADSSLSGPIVEYDEAVYHQKKALKLWPETSKGLSKEAQDLLFDLRWSLDSPTSTFQRCRTSEEYYLKLLESRFRETKVFLAEENAAKATKDGAERRKLLAALKLKRQSQQLENDPLFTDGTRTVRYVDDQGHFAPGKIAAAELALFPDGKIDNAIMIVQQLLFWLPRDLRLYRQLGELYNARGKPRDLLAAKEILNDIVEKQQQTYNEDLRRREAEIAEFVIPKEKQDDNAFEFDETQKLRDENRELKDKQNNLDKKLNDAIDAVLKIRENPPVNWQTIGVTFVFGLSLGLVGLWQVQEIVRRRRKAG